MTPTTLKPSENTQESLFCSQCGAASEYGAIFCRKCGAALLSPSELVEFRRQLSNVSVPQVRPWVRFWARMFDIALWNTVLGVLVGICFPTAFDWRVGELEWSAIALVSWILVESVLLSALGTTPGKSLLRIKLSLPSDTSIPFLRALSRSFKVWWRGLGAGFMPVGVFTLGHAHSVLIRDSITSWDREGGFVVRHERVGAVRALVAGVFLALFYSVGVYAAFMGQG